MNELYDLSSLKDDTNPHYFVMHFEEGEIRFYRGKKPVVFNQNQLEYLINSDDFYENANTMISIAQDPESFGKELVNILASEFLYVKLHKAVFTDGYASFQFEIDLNRHDLVAVNDRWAKYHDEYDVWITVNVGDVSNLRSIVDKLINEVTKELGSSAFQPNLEY